MLHRCKSYTKAELVVALKNGETLWELDTGNDGEDDILVGKKGDIELDLCNFHNVEELPDHWELRDCTDDFRDLVVADTNNYFHNQSPRNAAKESENVIHSKNI